MKFFFCSHANAEIVKDFSEQDFVLLHLLPWSLLHCTKVLLFQVKLPPVVLRKDV